MKHTKNQGLKQVNAMNNYQIKLVVSFFALSIIIARLLLPNLEIDAITLGLLIVAVLPWFSDLLQSAELPGGWKVVFKDIADIRNKQEVQGREIELLTFLINNFLNQSQLRCLSALKLGDEFLFDKNSIGIEQDKDDLRRLFATGLITRRPGRGFRKLFDEGPDVQSVNEFFCITNMGEKFLELLNPDETNS